MCTTPGLGDKFCEYCACGSNVAGFGKGMEICMEKYVLEACVDSVESALAALRGGANRLEICANLVIGGTTPGVSQFKQIREACDVPLHVLIRPRYGDFLYTEHEFRMLIEDAEMFCALGADGVVTGCLNADGSLDRERMKILREKTVGAHLTLHRAFDVCRNPYEALEQAIELGVDTILTSGQRETCLQGRKLIEELIAKADGRIHILIGSGVNAETIDFFMKETGARNFHMSGKMILDSHMTYRKEDVSMGIPGIGEYDIFRTDEKQIRMAVQVIQRRLGEY